MEQQSRLSGATVLPARAPEGVPPTPPRLAASTRHIPGSVWPGRMSCSPDQDGPSDSPPAPSLSLAASENYTFVAQGVAPPASAPLRPYHFDSSSFATPHDILWPGHSNNATPTRLPEVAAEACGTALPRKPAASPGSQGGGLTQASTSPTGPLDAGSPTSLVTRTRLGDDSGTEVTEPFKPVGNPSTVVHAIRNGSLPEAPRTATVVVACHRPRTHPAGAAHGHPADTSGNNYAGQSESDKHDGHQNGEHNDDNNGRQSGDEPEEDQGERGESGSKTNRRAQPAPDGPLNCPYRKRNKQRFNIRDHVRCTKSFKNLSALKTHVRKFHLIETPPPQQENQTEDVEDGITRWAAEQLRDRKDRVKVCTWEGLWRTLFPLDREVPLPAYEPCTVMATDEVTGIDNTARLRAKEVVLARVSDLLRRRYGCIDSDAIASALTDDINLIYEESSALSLRIFEHKIRVPQAPPAPGKVPGPSRSGEKRPNKQGKQGNHDSRGQTPSTIASSQHGEQQVPLRHIAPLAPSLVRDVTLAPPGPSPYPPLNMPHQQQSHAPNTFPPVRDTGYQGWPFQVIQGRGAYVAPTSDQYGFQPARMAPPPPSNWFGDGSAEHQYRVNMQHNQSPAAGSYPAPHPSSIATHASHQRPLASNFSDAPEPRQQPPSSYGIHANRHSRPSEFAGWPGNNNTTGNDGNQDAT